MAELGLPAGLPLLRAAAAMEAELGPSVPVGKSLADRVCALSAHIMPDVAAAQVPPPEV